MANRKKEVIRSAIAVFLPEKWHQKTGALRLSSVPAIEPKY